MVALLTLLVFLLEQLKQVFTKLLFFRLTPRHLKNSLCGLAVGGIFVGITVVGALKNLNFYGFGYDGLVNMLSHGIGTVLKPILTTVSWPPLILTATILVFVVRKAIKKSHNPMVTTMLFICFGCGLFGYTTLSMAIVPMLIILGRSLPDYSLPN